MPASAYAPVEIEAIAGWLREADSAAQIAAKFSSGFRHVSRNAVIGLVSRNAILKAIGFANGRGGNSMRPAKARQEPRARPKTKPKPRKPVRAGAIPSQLPGRLKALMAAAADTGIDMKVYAMHARPARCQHGPQRTVDDMIAAANAPIAPTATEPGGLTLADCPARGCRFPVGAQGGVTTFCAVEVSAWLPGSPSGCYCGFHRAYLSGCAADADDRAPAATDSIFRGEAA